MNKREQDIILIMLYNDRLTIKSQLMNKLKLHSFIEIILLVIIYKLVILMKTNSDSFILVKI